jgi:methyltransferase
MNTLSVIVLLLVTAQRLSELIIARRNTARLVARGGIESGGAHYPVMVVLHAAWLGGLWFFALWQQPSLPLLGLYAAAQGFRLWILASLGQRWTTRIITVPGESLVARGPYKYLRHPNYLLVAVEIPLLPLVFGLWAFALLFALLNFAMLAWRIRVENASLSAISRT